MLIRIVLLCFFSSCSFGAEIRVITFDIAPWAYRSANNEYFGVFPDLMREVEKRTGHRIIISLAPIVQRRIYRELESGRQDCAMTVAGEPRKTIKVVGDPVFDLPVGVIARKGVTLKSDEDLKDLSISILNLLSKNNKFMSAPDLHTVSSPDYISGLRKILHGRVDAIAGAIPTILYIAKANDMSGLLGEPFIMNIEPVVWQCSIDSYNLINMDEVNQEIKNIKQDKVLKKIIDSHSWG